MHLGQVKRVEGLEAGAQQRGRLGPLVDGTVLALHGDGIDLDPFWRHAGACRCLRNVASFLPLCIHRQDICNGSLSSSPLLDEDIWLGRSNAA